MPEARHYAATELETFAVKVLRSAGADDVDARLCAESMLDASLRGIDSHGVVALLARYVADVRTAAGVMAEPQVAERGPVVRVFGNGALGPRTGRTAVDRAVAAARERGVGTAVGAGAGYLGALSWLVAGPAEAGLIVLATCNGMAFVAPFGGSTALHGTNPIAVGIPASPDPLVLDMRTNAFAMDDFHRALATGTPLPLGALRDADGKPVTEARSILARGWDGIVSEPLAGPRGFGLALVVDILTAGLAGGLIGHEVDAERERDGLSLFVLALDPSAFGPRHRFDATVQRLLDQIASAPASGPEPVRYPGERAAAERRRRLATGIPVETAHWERMLSDLAAVGIRPAEPPSVDGDESTPIGDTAARPAP